MVLPDGGSVVQMIGRYFSFMTSPRKGGVDSHDERDPGRPGRNTPTPPSVVKSTGVGL